jgi:hypothetical protein
VLPIAQGDNGRALKALPGNLVVLAKTKCPTIFGPATRSRRYA